MTTMLNQPRTRQLGVSERLCQLELDDDHILNGYALGHLRDMQAEIDRLRAEVAELQRKLFVDRLSDAEKIRKELAISMENEDRRNREENARLRAEVSRLEKLNKANSDGWAEAVELNRKALTPIEADRLRAEVAELREALEPTVGWLEYAYNHVSSVTADKVKAWLPKASAILAKMQKEGE